VPNVQILQDFGSQSGLVLLFPQGIEVKRLHENASPRLSPWSFSILSSSRDEAGGFLSQAILFLKGSAATTARVLSLFCHSVYSPQFSIIHSSRRSLSIPSRKPERYPPAYCPHDPNGLPPPTRPPRGAAHPAARRTDLPRTPKESQHRPSLLRDVVRDGPAQHSDRGP